MLRRPGGGSRELLVSSQDTACYGFDQGTDLGHLLRRLTALPGDFRIRVGMMNQTTFPDRDSFIPAWLDGKIYKFIHLPVQSGSDHILAEMGRGYRAAEVARLIGRLRKACPEMTLSTDVIAGFPGETSDDHLETVKLLKEIRPDIVNVTRFSSRPGTPAHRSREKVPGRIAKDRSRELSELRFDIAREINERLVGSTLEILITEVGKGDSMVGRTSTYKPVVIKKALPLGSKASVKITSSLPLTSLGNALRSDVETRVERGPSVSTPPRAMFSCTHAQAVGWPV